MNLSKHRLEGLILPTVGGLERGLQRQSPHIPESLQLRNTVCGMATAALQLYLHEVHDVPTERLITYASDAPRGPNSRRLSHVVLRYCDYIIDPTHGQFMSFIGLDPRTASDDGLEYLYPDEKVAVYEANRWREFANSFAKNAFRIDQQKAVPKPTLEMPPFGALRGAPLPDTQRAYQAILNPAGYSDFPLTAQRPDFQEAAKEVADSIPRR